MRMRLTAGSSATPMPTGSTRISVSSSALARASAASPALRALMSRWVLTMSMIAPLASRTGEELTDTGTSDPSLRRRTVSRSTMGSPRSSAARAAPGAVASGPPGTASIAMGRPMASASV
jgi:hypothetical protein